MEENKLDKDINARSKLTDEEIAKAIVQSIEYSKTITYFDEWGNCKSIMMTDILDLIHRLHKENEELKSPKFASWKLKFFNLKEEFDKELAEHEEFTKKQKAEIERLTEEIKSIKEITSEQVVESEKLKQYCAEAVNSFIRLETLYKVKCQELEIANKKLEELKGGKID